jgi:hypothetical protein
VYPLISAGRTGTVAAIDACIRLLVFAARTTSRTGRKLMMEPITFLGRDCNESAMDPNLMFLAVFPVPMSRMYFNTHIFSFGP